MTKRPAAARLEAWTVVVESQWDELSLLTAAGPFTRPGWIRCVVNAFFPGVAVKLLVVRRGDAIAGVLPLLTVGRSHVSPTTWHTPRFGPVLADPPAGQAMAEAICSLRGRQVVLRFIDAENQTLRQLHTADARGLTIQRVLMRSPYVDVSGDWEDYLKRFSTSWRRNVRRRWRRLSEFGDVSFDITYGGDRLGEHLEAGLRVEAASWKGEAGTAIISDPRTRRFYTDIAYWAAAVGTLRLAHLRVDGGTAAFVYGLEQDNTFYALKTAYDPAFQAAGPGGLQMLKLIEHAFTSPRLSRFELLGADEPWKRELSDAAHVLVESRTFTGRHCARADLFAARVARVVTDAARERVPPEAWARAAGARDVAGLALFRHRHGAQARPSASALADPSELPKPTAAAEPSALADRQ